MSNSKRKLLRSLGVAGIAGAGLPATWTRPVVQSVVLPVHAQTTESEASDEAGSGCPRRFSLEAFSATCADTAVQRVWFYHWVDDSGSCPVLVSQVGGSKPTFSNYFYRSYVNTLGTQVRHYLSEYPAELTWAANSFCGNFPVEYAGPYTFQLLSEPGLEPWQVYYDATVNDSGVTTSEILITKV